VFYGFEWFDGFTAGGRSSRSGPISTHQAIRIIETSSGSEPENPSNLLNENLSNLSNP